MSRPSPHPLPLAVDRSAATRRSLLAAAGGVFAKRGLRAATVREICAEADANVAAVCYHFGSKEELYAEVLREAFRAALAKYPPLLGLPADAPAARRLHAFVHSLLLRILDEDTPTSFGKLMLREIAEPTPALGDLVEHHLRPVFQLLLLILSQLFDEAAPGRRVPPAELQRCAAAILGQCLFFQHAKPVFSRLGTGVRTDRAALDGLAERITQFSLAGIADAARTKGSNGHAKKRSRSR